MIKIISKAFYCLRKIDNRVYICYTKLKEDIGFDLCIKPYFIVAFDLESKVFVSYETQIIKNVNIKKILDSYFIVKGWFQNNI